MRILKIIFLLILFLASNRMEAQVENYDFQYFSTKQGLSNLVIRGIYQDKNGIMWFSTNDGLTRFDGQEFKVFTKKENQLKNNLVGRIYEDNNNRLWFGYANIDSLINFSVFDKNLEQAISFDEYFSDAPFKRKGIYQFFRGDDEVWMITLDGELYRYHDGFEFVKKDKDFINLPKGQMIGGDILIRLKKEIKIYKQNGDLKHTFPLPIDSIGKSNINIINDQLLWLHYNHFKYQFKIFDLNNHSTLYEKTGNIGKASFGNGTEKPIHISIRNEKFNRVWIGGLDFLKTLEADKTEVDFSKKLADILGHYSVNYLFEDRSQNIWVGTNKGLVLITPKEKLFKTFVTNTNGGYNSIRGIEEYDDEQLFVTSYLGFFLLNKNTKDTILTHPNVDSKYIGLGSLTIGDTILVGDHHYSFWTLDKKKYSLQQHLYTYLPTKTRTTETKLFHQDRFNQIWIKTLHGLFLLDLETLLVSQPENIKNNILSQIPINYIFENKKGLWVGSSKGLFLMNHQGAIIEEFKELKDFQISYIHQNKRDEFWLATKANGLVKWNYVTRSIHSFSKNEGISHDFLNAIIEDDFGFFWLPTNNGLVRFNPKNFATNIFYQKDGIAHNEFNRFSYLKSKDGKIYLGGLNGITGFDPQDFLYLDSDSLNTPLIVSSLKKLKFNEKDYQKMPIKNNQSLYLNMETDDKSFEFDFFLLDYANSFQSTYAYKIEGYDQKWTNLSTNQLRINRLPYGDYILKVKAKGSKETWSNQVLELPINVLRPFYLTWQFILVGLIALLALGYMIIQWRLKILENRNLELERVVAERTKELEQNSKELAQNAEVLAQNSKELADLNQTKDQFFAIIAHDMRGLVLSFKNVSQKVGFLRRKGREKEVDVFLKNIDKSADNLSNLLDNLLNWALVEKGVFPYHPELFNLERVVMENIKLFTELSRIKDIPLSYEVHETLNVYADKNAVSTIIRNLMNNAIKYSSPGAAVIIKAHQVDGKIQIEIKDTGEGIESEALEKIFQLDTKKPKQGTLGEKGTGLGLVLCKELVMLNKGDINIKSEEGKGTSVFVGLPMVA